MPPPESTSDTARDFGTALSRVQRRLRAAAVLRAIAVGLLVMTVGAILERAVLGVHPAVRPVVAIALFLAVAITTLLLRHRSWTTKAAAASIEAASPQSRNLIVTAEELRRHPERATTRVVERVLAEAARFAGAADIGSAVPLTRDIALSVAALVAMTLTLLGVPQRTASAIRDGLAQASGLSNETQTSEMRIVATITPPAYLLSAERTVDDPDRLDAIAGSRLRLSVSGAKARRVRFGEKSLATSAADGSVHAEMLLTESGYLAIDSPAGDAAGRRLIAVAVTPDRVPSILIDQPGKDLLVPDSRPTIPIRTSANDDFGLRMLELRFTKVSGSGEQFEFEEGTVPLEVARRSSREWKGQAALALAQMNLQPGDSVVYRVVGRDARPGDDGLASSDTFFVEVAGPGQVTLAGFELPPERERYALSQQMIVLKIQRLRAREQSLARPVLVEETAAIAAEQRSVRANFIFLTGGQVEDEVEEAEHSHEVQEGRLENTARREIGIAIQHMGRADQSLIAVDTSAALAAARAAVEALQRAFGRNRYILRTLPVRSRIDPSRRLTGDLDRAADASREIATATPEKAALTSRHLLSRLIDIKPALGSQRSKADELTSLAEEALSVDGASDAWQRIAKELVATRNLVRDGRIADADSKLTEVLALLLTEARRHAVAIPPGEDTDRALRSAWAAERHRR